MNNFSPAAGKRENLPEIASEVLILTIQLRSTNEYGDSTILKNKILEVIDKFEQRARSLAIDNEKIRMAKFALIAFIDESIISSSWSRKDDWLAEPLQLKIFDTFNAGEEFFTNLEMLRQRTGSNKDVLEIYFLCLSLGFKGKYQLQSPENLRRIIDELNLELHPEMYKSVDALSPSARPKEEIVISSGGRIPVWAYPLGVIILIILIELVLSYFVSGKSEDTAGILKSLL